MVEGEGPSPKAWRGCPWGSRYLGRVSDTPESRPSKFLDADALPWRPFEEAPGVSFKVLSRHPPGNGATLLLRFDPDTSYPTHRHPAGEEYYVLEGELRDGAQSYGAGTYVRHPPGSVHRPSSPIGAIVLVFVPGGIELV